jgi:hypothetical protein
VFHRYHIETVEAPEISTVPTRFLVKVKKAGLAGLILRELIHYRGDWKIVSSRPCMYGVFGGPVGGFSPRPHLCVGCLRCTMQYPEFVQISPNPHRKLLGDAYFVSGYVDAIYYEARSGRIPVKGAGYRGPFGGENWDGMWTDMSEIVRPTRDGIHGREFISTSVDIGAKPAFLAFDSHGQPVDPPDLTRLLTIPLPMLLDAPPDCLLRTPVLGIFERAAAAAQTRMIVPVRSVSESGLRSGNVIPLVKQSEIDSLLALNPSPAIAELDGADESAWRRVSHALPQTTVWVRIETGTPEDFLRMARAGARVFHLAANYHGRSPDGRFVLDVIRQIHAAFLEAGLRDEVTLIGSGGIIAAEHVAKSILCGLDAVALDTPPLVSIQSQFHGECVSREAARFTLAPRLDEKWAAHRLTNLLASWRDQILELMGAMGIREVRRLRGEMGRAMFQKDLEREAFAGIEGYGD